LTNNLSFPITGTFATWKTVDLSLPLLQGSNTLKLISTTAEGLVNIDQIGYVSAGLMHGNCVITGLEEDTKSSFLIAPNPFLSQFMIQSKGKFTYKVMDQKGIVLNSGEATEKIAIGEELPIGIYLLEIETSDSKRIVKMVKN